jgi:hypothetical protein
MAWHRDRHVDVDGHLLSKSSVDMEFVARIAKEESSQFRPNEPGNNNGEENGQGAASLGA